MPASLINTENSDPRMHAADLAGETLKQIHKVLFYLFLNSTLSHLDV